MKRGARASALCRRGAGLQSGLPPATNGACPRPTLVIPLLTCLLLGSALCCLGQPKSELRPPPPLDPAQSVSEARALLANMLAIHPDQDSTNTGVLRIRPRQGPQEQFPVRIELLSTGSNWSTIYQTLPPETNSHSARLEVVHTLGQPNVYRLSEPADAAPRLLAPAQTMIPFAGSDFWVGDLGLEFLHWPGQHVLRKELRRSQSCGVLESTNSSPATGGYSRVVCWVDLESGGVVHGDAYDSRNNLLKQFDPTGLKKVQGQYQLEEMEMRNHQTGSRSWIRFDLATE